MKTFILLFYLLLGSLANSQSLDSKKETDSSSYISRKSIDVQGETYFVYRVKDACVFTVLNKISKKEKLLRVCPVRIYQTSVAVNKTESRKISEILKDMEEPDVFENIIHNDRFTIKNENHEN